MSANALPMSEAAYGRIAELLGPHGVRVEPFGELGEFRVLRCVRDDVGILLSMTRPVHWAAAGDERRDKVLVAALGESLWRFWRIPRENRLRAEIVALLRPLEWRPR